MRKYHDTEEDLEDHPTPPWMTLFISLMLVVLTLFIFLSTFSKGDKRKVRDFKREFRKSLMLSGEGNPGSSSVVDVGTADDPVQHLINRMKSKGIDKKLMDDFLTLQQIKDLEVRDGRRGVSIILPEVVGFGTGKDGLTLTDRSKTYLASISHLVSELPYLVVVKGYATGKVPPVYIDALEYSARRAHRVYSYFLAQNVAAVKLKVSGCGDAFQASDVPQNKVEITFKSAEL